VQIGLVGLGRMGADMSRRWLRAGHSVVGYARDVETVNGLLVEKAISAGVGSLADLVSQLARPRIVWLMVPAASVDATLGEIAVLTTALYERFTSRGEADFADRVLSALRLGFGGHEEAEG
jgi:6-phosphogluconate dehydrogenase